MGDAILKIKTAPIILSHQPCNVPNNECDPHTKNLATITIHMFNTVKKIKQVNKHSTIKGMNISAGAITRPKSCLKMAPFMSVKY